MRSTKTILIVDDDIDLREVYAMALELEGYHVVQADDGQNALMKLLNAENPVIPDCIVLDLRMPTMTGNIFLNIIRTNYKSRFENIPVVVCSAHGEDVDSNQISTRLYKPVSLTEFVESVGSALLKAEMKKSPQFFQDL